MKYSLEQKDEIKSTIFRIRLKRHELEELVDEVNDIAKDPKERYLLSFYYTEEERLFEIPSSRLIDYYNTKITNLKSEIISLEKRSQKLVK
ncbi:TPA: hypothetical protein U3984_001870 [Enterococcus faecium]|nr:hypothetical protein [Enterococcus faecium]HEO0685630.1 hypothetical protein [Enterococcus faecium]